MRRELGMFLKAITQRVFSLLTRHSRIAPHIDSLPLRRFSAGAVPSRGTQRMNAALYGKRTETENSVARQIRRLAGEIGRITRVFVDPADGEFDLTAELYNLQSVYNDIGRARIALSLQSAALEILTREEEREILSLVRDGVRHRVRQAHATRVVISIRRLGRKIRLNIMDDGKNLAADNRHGRNLDIIRSLKHRAAKLRGTMHVHAEQGHRARITVEFFLEPTLTIA
ncbi:sensor histidine kinase [Candidatus Nitrospira inopinata]|nr:hypothetical protein [Candidatus Nitrospira inopinata]